MSLQSNEDSERDEFISQMLEMNARIRQFQQMASVELARKCSEVSADGEQGKATDGNQGKGKDCHNVNNKNETDESEDMVIDLADKLSSIEAEMHALKEEYRKDLLVHKQVRVTGVGDKVLLVSVACRHRKDALPKVCRALEVLRLDIISTKNQRHVNVGD